MCQLLKRPVILTVRSFELFQIEPGAQCSSVYVQRSAEEVFPLLRIVLGLIGIVHHVFRTDRHAIVRIGLLMLDWIKIVHVAFFILISPCHKSKKGIIFHDPLSDLHGVLHTAIAERIDIITGCGNADHQLVRISLASFLETVVLSWLFICSHFIRNAEIAVEGILTVRIRWHCLNLKRSVRCSIFLPELVLDRMLDSVVLDLEHRSDLLILQ